jgi:hypothetical protein
LNDVITDTMLPDGAQIEQSQFYHSYQLSFLMEIENWIQREPEAAIDEVDGERYDFATCANGSTFDSQIEPNPQLDLLHTIDAAVRVTTHTTMPSGEIPMLGRAPSPT